MRSAGARAASRKAWKFRFFRLYTHIYNCLGNTGVLHTSHANFHASIHMRRDQNTNWKSSPTVEIPVLIYFIRWAQKGPTLRWAFIHLWNKIFVRNAAVFRWRIRIGWFDIRVSIFRYNRFIIIGAFVWRSFEKGRFSRWNLRTPLILITLNYSSRQNGK